jgi:hypothetical protein
MFAACIKTLLLFQLMHTVIKSYQPIVLARGFNRTPAQQADMPP